MEYPHKYFEDEVREGFYITGELKRIWAAQLEVLSEVDKVCKRHNIKWFADCGTLLGTIRHKGYIPWDDDLDICMLRDDYIKFNEVANKELPEGYSCINLKDKETFYEYLTRVVNGRKFDFGEEFLEKHYDCHYPTGIDVFPLDYVSTDPVAEQERKDAAFDVYVLSDSVTPENEDDPEFDELVRSVEAACGVTIDSSLPMKQQMYIAAESLFTLFGSKDAKEVVLMPYWLKDNNHKYPIECFRDTIMMPFEYTELPVPVEYDRVLKIEYGDYMRPSEAGGVHDYPFFEGLENILINRVDKYYFRYKFKPEDLKNDERKTALTTKKQVVNYIDMTKEAHDAIAVMVAQGKMDVACDLLAACQESTINIGNLLESAFGEGFSAVAILEEYCESVYQLYTALSQGEFGAEDAAGVSSFLDDIYARMKSILTDKVIDRKEIVFIPYRADYWRSMESMWEAYKKKEEYDVYVVPVPYYKKTSRSELTDMYYEGDKLPDYVEVTDYKNFSFEKRHPDIIVTQNPYDECNYVMSLGLEHYSRTLKKYTEQLIYIPPFIMNEVKDEGSKSWKTMDYFCAVPGVVHADKVMVQSEQMRAAYIKRLTEMAGEDTEDVWNEKICVNQYPVTDEMTDEDKKKERKEIINGLPDEWKRLIIRQDGDFKKILLYNIGVASLAQYGEKTLFKIENTLNKFKEVKDDIAVIWYCNPHLLRTMKKVDLRLRDRLSKLVEQYKSEGWGIYTDMPDYGDLIKICDAYYGDAGNIPYTCRLDKKPVMLQNVEVVV